MVTLAPRPAHDENKLATAAFRAAQQHTFRRLPLLPFYRAEQFVASESREPTPIGPAPIPTPGVLHGCGWPLEVSSRLPRLLTPRCTLLPFFIASACHNQIELGSACTSPTRV